MLRPRNLSLGSGRRCNNMMTMIGEEDGSSRRSMYTHAIDFSLRYIILRTDRLQKKNKTRRNFKCFKSCIKEPQLYCTASLAISLSMLGSCS